MEKTLKMVAGIAIYNSNPYSGSYLEVFDIKNGKVINPRPLTPEQAKGLLSVITEKESSVKLGHIEPNMMYLNIIDSDNIEMVWWEPPQKMEILSDLECIPTDDYYIPGLLYHCKGDEDINVYAYKGTSFKKGDKLFQAPFPNIGSGGDLCLGTAKSKVEKKGVSGWIEYCKEMVWKSKFTAIHTNLVLDQTSDEDLEKIELVFEKAKTKPFDENQLIPIEKTYESITK